VDAGVRSDEEAAAQHPGARPAERRRAVSAWGLRLAVYEWGDERAPAIVLTHGGFDFAGTFEVFAPLLAVLDSIGEGPLVLVGHSKGGAISTHLIQAVPQRVRAFVNLDGIPSHKPPPDVADHERTRLLARELSGWLDQRRAAEAKTRRPDTLDGLARRRQKMNPRLPLAWLRHLVTLGARRDPDGWRWKIDPTLRPGGFGPWRAVWSMARFASLPVPLLGILATENEPMGWDTCAADVRPFLPPGARVLELAGAGHFVHIEQPQRVAELVLDFLARLA